MRILNKDINILETITKKDRIFRLSVLCISCFFLAFFYNAFIARYHIVFGGLGGIAIILEEVFGINTTITYDICTVALLIISYFIVGKKDTRNAIVGFVIYDIMINITTPLANVFDFTFDSFTFAVVLVACLYGLCVGLVLKMGFNTGGFDILYKILQHFIKLPISNISNIVNSVIILVGVSIFGITSSIYAILFLIVFNMIANKVLIGESNYKLVYIKSKKNNEVKDYLKNDLELGYSLVNSQKLFGIIPQSIILCVVPNNIYYELQRHIINMDNHATVISNNCYAVYGGYTNNLLKNR